MEHTPRVMIVEDDERLALLTRDYLVANGLDVSVVSNGNEAIRRIPAEEPDLVVLDLMLPGADGLTVCREVRKSFRNPILMLTARSDDMDQVLGLEMGADDYVHITVADKRQIGHLLVVSGPTSAGKKTLMRKLLANELPALAERLGTADSSIWGEPFNAQKNFIPTEPVREHMILHQDFMRPFLRSAISHERDEGNDILGTARRITFITVWAEPDKLAKQITKAEIEPFQARGKKPRRHLRIREVYEDGDKVLEHYERWFAFTEGKSTDHIVVSPHDGFSMHSIEEWRDLVSRRQESR